MATKNYIGETIHVVAALPTANTAAAFAEMDWTKAAGVQQLPQFGISHGNTDVEDLETGFTAGVKGAGAGNDSQMAFRDLGTATRDPGQQIIKDAAESAGGDICVRITPKPGDTTTPVKYAQGYAHSYIENQGNVSAFKGFTVNFKQNAPTVEAPQAAP